MLACDSAGGVSAGSTSAGSDPAGGNPAGSFEPADKSNLLSFHLFFLLTSPSPVVERHQFLQEGVNSIQPQSQDSGDLASPISDKNKLKNPSLVKVLSIWIYSRSTNEPIIQINFIVCLVLPLSRTTSIAKSTLRIQIGFAAMQEEINIHQPARTQDKEEGIEYDEEFAPVGQIEAIRQYLAFCFLIWIPGKYHMDVKIALLYGDNLKRRSVKQLPDETATTPYEAAKTKLKDESDPPVNCCSRHQFTPLTSQLNAVQKDIQVSKGQPKLGFVNPLHVDVNFLGRRLIFHGKCKKQTIVATSSTEAEYVAAASCCAQVLWIQNQLLDYGFNFMNTKIFIDNQSTICIVKNPVFHQRTKHIEIRHHFIRDANEKNLIQVLKIHTDDNVADLLTKAFDGPRFAYLVVHIGMVDNTAARVYVPAVCMVSAVGGLFLLAEYIHAAGVVYAANTSIHAAGLVCAGSIMFLLADLFLLVVTCFCCAQLDIAGWLVSATSHLVSAGSLHSCWCNNVSAA
ncbi:hypothetical protein Tco_0271167 [Tanacetum coccineum]